jgi:hypothetical protein
LCRRFLWFCNYLSMFKSFWQYSFNTISRHSPMVCVCVYIYIQWTPDFSILDISFSSLFRSLCLVPNKVPYKQCFLFRHFSFPGFFGFSAFFDVNHVPDSISHVDFVSFFVWEKKLKIEESY